MARTVRQNAGVIGLGIIGSRVAANLRKAGFQTWVWNRTPRPEPNFLSSASEVAESAKIIQIFVSDGPALIETIEAMAPVIGPEHIILNHATIAPKETLEAARLIHDRHAKYLDAPFTGSRDAADAAQLVFFIGGEIDVLERARPQLEVNAKTILPIGEIGQAAAMKIATNLIVAVAVGSFAEAMCLIETSGIPLYKLGEALQIPRRPLPSGRSKDAGDDYRRLRPEIFAQKHVQGRPDCSFDGGATWHRLAGGGRVRRRRHVRNPKGLG